MPPIDDCDPIQDAKHAREGGTIPARTPTLTELHRRWMHARLKREQADRAANAAYAARTEAEKEEQEAAVPLARALLADTVRGMSDRSRGRTVAIAGEVLSVCELGVDHPGEFSITPMPVEVVSLG